MVVNGSSANSQATSAKIVDLYPQSIDEIRNGPHSKFVLKFSSAHCPPCRQMESWLKDAYAPKGVVVIYHIKVDDRDSAMVETLCGMFSVMAVPRLIFTDKSLKPIKSVIGFKQQEISGFLDDYFTK